LAQVERVPPPEARRFGCRDRRHPPATIIDAFRTAAIAALVGNRGDLDDRFGHPLDVGCVLAADAALGTDDSGGGRWRCRCR